MNDDPHANARVAPAWREKVVERTTNLCRTGSTVDSAVRRALDEVGTPTPAPAAPPLTRSQRIAGYVLLGVILAAVLAVVVPVVAWVVGGPLSHLYEWGFGPWH